MAEKGNTSFPRHPSPLSSEAGKAANTKKEEEEVL